ncbi:NBAS subunit of NRZ tethering complex isoform X1 [Danio rerio]|uniref:NBAS subunit of NRZ tethering complex isoform X1 n=3 Tax=Danio rerio TaxID=7955 RepID=A0AC58I341_DANRE|nr:neuroblastoma-amplified sequence isoform X1 [Danio rerio]|eukprot:XP_005160753.1 neuroblastoma-amplified sequence isoform X1 [Danio rerio]
MAGDIILEDEEENILYDLLVNTEWPPETDTQLRGLKEHNSSLVAKAVTGPFRFFLHYLWYSPSSSTLPPGLVRLATKQVNWQLVLASNGKLLAVVQDQCVEIRSARDDFGSIIGKCQVPKDPNPHWRRVAWSHDCALLAYADSTGTVRVFDLMGSELFIIPPAMSFPGDFSYAAAGLMFLEYTGSAQWSAELLVITYSGQLKSYLVSVGTNQGFQENHTFSFSAHYSNGITTAIYHPGHRLLLVGGCESGDSDVSRASQCGITAWRVLSGLPHYKQVTSYEDDISSSQRRGFFKMPSFRLFSRHNGEQDGVFRMSLSPDGTILAVIHFSGSLSLWDIPSFKLRGSWKQEEQPGFDEINPEWKTSLEKRKKIKDKEQYQSLLDVSWWSETALILARCSGALTVSSVRTLKNLLGKSCEWFEPSPRVTSAHDGGFLSLECEVKLAHKRSRLESSVKGEEDDGDDDSDSDEEASAKARYFGYVKQGLYYVTEMERFAPPRKRPRTVIKNYRLVSLRSTTPEELYQRKIDNEEYGEALSLAQAYGLDSDLVYQRQWRKSTVSIASIQDYLSKIKKRSWVLHECVERVPENVDAAKELLQYGLKGTDLEALIAIGAREDQGRFILSGDLDMDDAPYEDFLSMEEELEQRKERESKKRQELLKKVDFSKLTLEQKELCRSRLKLLCYLDRLATYEEILGGPHAAEQRFDGEFFKKFRNQNIVLSARTYARESNVQALDILFTYHGAELLQHRLAILCNFPETTSPHEYSDLLPKAGVDKEGNLVLIPWEESRHRDLDWCEVLECREVVEPKPMDDCQFLYEEQPELERFRSADPFITLLTEWYLTRAQDIESHSRQVDCSLSLVRLGKEQNIPGLERLCDDLVTMETLVYETSCDLSVTLKELQQLRDIDKLRLLMKNSSEDRYVRNCFQWMVPFLHRCEGQRVGSASSLLREYLVTLAKDDLTLPLKLFQHSKPDCHPKIIGDSDQLMTVALKCIYSCERDDQLALCYDVLECLPQRGYGPETDTTKALHDQVDTLEKHLSVAEVLEKHGLQKPISFVRNSQNSKEEAHQLMVRLTRHTGRKNPPVSETVWRSLLQDLLDMQQNVYTCLEPETCHQVFVESLLCSSREENVRLAGQLMHCSGVSEDTPVSVSLRGKAHARVSYSRSVELVLAAAREYFNSSATLSDPCMSLARSCLQLITDCPPLVQEELDLITALSRLEQFGVKILPLQVRLRTDRLSLIKECISQCPTAYRQSLLLLSLARLLRVAGDDEAKRKGQVLTLLAEQALLCQDFKASYIHCQELMAAGYSEGWDVCAQLGQCETFTQLSGRQELMAFSLTHCPPSRIQTLLAASSSLQTQVLYQAVNYKIDPSQARRTGSELSEVGAAVPGSINPTDLLHRTTARTIEVLTNTTMSTKAVLTTVIDSHWWRESLSLLRPLHGPAVDRNRAGAANQNADLEKQGCSPFYEELFDDPYVNTSEDVYSSYHYNPQEDFAEVLLRTGKLAETNSEGQNLFPATEVLLQLASDAFPKDMTLALAYLLALPQVLDANTCFEKQPPSALSLHLAAYYYSLQIYSRLAPCFKDKCSPLYRADPRALIRLVTKHVTDHAGCDWPDEDLEALIGQLRLYSERLTDFTQAQVLQGLGRGVDVQRFSSDNQYKKETILGLAETLDENVYSISRSLAHRYSIPLWEVHMTHLEFLFTDSGLSTKDIEGRTEALGLFETLKTDPESFYMHMTKYVYPSIAGTDQLRLLFYFTLLENCGCANYFSQTAMKPDTHLKLLKKLKAVAVGLDYKKMTEENSDPLKALEPILTSQNVLSISKLASRIPQKGGEALTSSAVHSTWLHKLFWEGDQHVLKKAPQTDQDFLHAYDTCAKYFDRLLPVDFVNFLDAITFSPEAANKLSVGTRLEITKRAQKALKSISDKTKKKGNDDRSENSAFNFDTALTHVQQSLTHLETLSHSFLLSLKTSQEELLQKYSRIYDLSRSEQSKVHHLAVTMATDGQPLERIEQLLSVAVGTSDLSPKSVVQDAVERIISALSGDKDVLKDYADPLKVLEGIVAVVHTNVQSGGNIVTSEDMLEWLRPFCGDDTKPVRPRIEVLQILEHSFNLSDQDIHLLVYFRSQAILKACWPNRKCEMEDVENEKKRNSLFLELLESSSKWEEFQHLMLLLQAWPPVTDKSRLETDQNPWVCLTSTLLVHSSSVSQINIGNEVLSMCRSLYLTKHKLNPQGIGNISSLLLNAGLKLPALKLMTESKDEHLLKLTQDQIRNITEVTEEVCDTELLSLLLNAGMLISCVDTAVYPSLVSHMLAQGDWDVEKAAYDLQQAGHSAQAGSLLLSYRGSHPGQFTFNSALAVIRKWL